MTDMSPKEFAAYVAKHVSDYFESDGAVGAVFNGLPCVVLTTVGAKSGALRHSPVIRVAIPDSPDYVVVASMGGAPKNPSWFHNLLASPGGITLQDGATRLSYSTQVVEGDERKKLWELAVSVYPLYEEYQANTKRVIPVVRLSPNGAQPLAQSQDS